MVTKILELLGVRVDVITREEAAAFLLQREVVVIFHPLVFEHKQHDTKGDESVTSPTRSIH